MNRRFFTSLLGSLAIIVLAACNGGGSSPGSGPIQVVSGGGGAPQRLYVTNAPPGQILVFNLPLTAASVPVATVGGGHYEMAFDPTGRLFAATGGTAVDAFTQPITSASIPAFSVNFSHIVRDVAFNSAGTLYAAENFSLTCCVQAMTGPVNAGSTPAFTLSGANFPYGVTVDPLGNVFAAGSDKVYAYVSPAGPGSIPFSFGTISNNYGIKSDAGGSIYVANGPANGKIDVYHPPYSAASTPAFAINVSTNFIGYPSFDAAGNLYVPVTNDNKVYVFNPPFSAASVPSVALSVPNAYGTAVGP